MKRKPVTAEDVANQTCIWADLVKAHQQAAAEANERKAWRAVTRASRRLVELSERFLAGC